jgi:hypothetical protein
VSLSKEAKKFVEGIREALGPAPEPTPAEQPAEEAVDRAGSSRVMRDFKILMANLAPAADVSGLTVELDGVRVSANGDSEGRLTSLTISGPECKKYIHMKDGEPLDAADFEAKVASCRVVK